MIWDESKYKNQEKFPRKENFTGYYVYQKGKCFLNGASKAEYNAFIHENGSEGFVIEVALNADKFKEAKDKWQEMSNDLMHKYKRRLYAEYGTLTDAQLDIIYNKAWEYSHSSGYIDVEYKFEELVDMCIDVMEN